MFVLVHVVTLVTLLASVQIFNVLPADSAHARISIDSPNWAKAGGLDGGASRI
jgi:hypothetical protein